MEPNATDPNVTGQQGDTTGQSGQTGQQGNQGQDDLLGASGQQTDPNVTGGDDDLLGASGQQNPQAETVPEVYEAFALPKELSDAGIVWNPESTEGKEFSTLAKELKLTQTQAQKLVDLYGNRMKEALSKDAQGFQQVKKDWVDAVRKDPEIGGVNVVTNVNQAKLAVTKFATPGFRQLLADTGLTNHPDFVKTFYNVARALGEDYFAGQHTGGSGQQTGGGLKQKSAADIMYSKSMG